MTGSGCGWSKISRVRAPYDNLDPAVKPLQSPESAVYIMDSLLGGQWGFKNSRIPHFSRLSWLLGTTKWAEVELSTRPRFAHSRAQPRAETGTQLESITSCVLVSSFVASRQLRRCSLNLSISVMSPFPCCIVCVPERRWYAHQSLDGGGKAVG